MSEKTEPEQTESRVDKVVRELLETTSQYQNVPKQNGANTRGVRLEADERILLDEAKCGWHKTLALTNKRLLLLNKNDVEDAIPLTDIVEAYADTQVFTNLTRLKIVTSKGGNQVFTLKGGSGLGLLLGGDDYITQRCRSLVERYASAINRAVGAAHNSLPK